MSLKTYLKTNREARRIFGKKEIGIILKQLDGIALTQSERNRLSRDIKPKLHGVVELSQFKDEFKLSKNQNNKRIIKETLELILQDPLKEKIEAVLLFGSQVTGPITPNSDIDLAVSIPSINGNEATRFRIRIAGRSNNKVDIQVFNVLPEKMRREIARNHRVLWKKPGFDNTSFTIDNLKEVGYGKRFEQSMGDAA